MFSKLFSCQFKDAIKRSRGGGGLIKLGIVSMWYWTGWVGIVCMCAILDWVLSVCEDIQVGDNNWNKWLTALRCHEKDCARVWRWNIVSTNNRCRWNIWIAISLTSCREEWLGGGTKMGVGFLVYWLSTQLNSTLNSSPIFQLLNSPSPLQCTGCTLTQVQILS